MTDEQKLMETKMAFINKIESVSDWDTFKTVLSQLTKAKVITFIKNNLQNSQQAYTDAAQNSTDTASDIGDLITEVDNI